MLLRISLAAAALLAAAPGHAAPRVGEIDIRTGSSGVPCFTITAAEEQRSGEPNFQSIAVSDSAAGVMWKMAMPKPRTFPLTIHMCVPYGGRLPVLPQTPSARLQSGKTYDVAIQVAPSRVAGAPRFYRGRFCVKGNEGAWTIARPDGPAHGACALR